MMSARDRLLKLIFEDDSDDELLFEESDEEVIENDSIPTHGINNETHELLNACNDQDFIMNFRLSKKSTLSLLEKIEEKLTFLSNRNSPISPVNQLLGTLRFYATGCHQQEAGYLCGFSKSSACRIIHRVSNAIASLAPDYIKFPETESEILNTKQDFYRIAQFPKVIGVMDCTHVKIKSPGGTNAPQYVNKKGFPSLNVQCICNANYEFTDIVAICCGNTRDCDVFNSSCIKGKLEEGSYYCDSFILVDKNYPSTTYFVPLLKKAETSSEILFNKSHMQTWSIVKTSIKNWKKRFPILAIGLRIKLDHVCDVIVATAVLHNIAQQNKEVLPPDDPNLKISWESLLQEGELNEDYDCKDPSVLDARHGLIQGHFKNLTESQSL